MDTTKTWKLFLKILYAISHPLMIFPIAIPVARYFGSYSCAQITELQEVPLFLQGSSDWGGSNLYSGTLPLYLIFGVLGASYLILNLSERQGGAFREDILYSFWILRFHIVLFLWAGSLLIWENDFRNMFLLAAVLYCLILVFIVVMHRRAVPLSLQLLIAPCVMLAWLLIGSDGTTAKAGQILQAYEDPQAIVRSTRHAIMLKWHALLNALLGDMQEIYENPPNLFTNPLFYGSIMSISVFFLLNRLGRRFKHKKN